MFVRSIHGDGATSVHIVLFVVLSHPVAVVMNSVGNSIIADGSIVASVVGDGSRVASVVDSSIISEGVVIVYGVVIVASAAGGGLIVASATVIIYQIAVLEL